VAANPQVDSEAALLEPLRGFSRRQWEDGSVLRTVLEIWRRTHRAEGVGIYRQDEEGQLRRQATAGSGSFPPRLASAKETPSVELPGGAVLIAATDVLPARDALSALDILVATASRLGRVSEQLKEQSFQENYKVVKLEALYDVGLAIASTLELEALYEEILLRAVSLLDARRGALYVLDGECYRLMRTIGGSAKSEVAPDEAEVEELAGGGQPVQDILPGASYLSAVPITVEREGYGLLVVADKESRHGVGPFLAEDYRALSMFAAQAAIALENAALHRQALEKERLERELELAAEIQRGILPASVPSLGSLEIVGWNRPTQQVGGDYYGFLRLGDGRLGVAVADVTGKGMPAALLVSTLHSALHLLLDRVQLGAELLARLNEHIADSSAPNKFITLIVVEVDEESGQIGYLNAGHNPGLLVRANGTVEQLGPCGLPLGLLRDSTYRYERIQMEPGDLLCLYSDGITECASPSDEEFGLDRLVASLVRHRARPLKAVLDAVEAEVAEFAEGLSPGDDQTVVLLRRQPR